jgi:hypothetical protein
MVTQSAEFSTLGQDQGQAARKLHGWLTIHCDDDALLALLAGHRVNGTVEVDGAARMQSSTCACQPQQTKSINSMARGDLSPHNSISSLLVDQCLWCDINSRPLQ